MIILQLYVGGDRRAGAREKIGGGRKREVGKRESRGGGNREKLKHFRNILLYFAIKIGQRRGNHYGKGLETKVKLT